LKTVKLKICRGRKAQLVVSNQVVTNPCCGLAVIFCGFIPLLIGRETINIPEIFSGVHGFTEKTETKIINGIWSFSPRVSPTMTLHFLICVHEWVVAQMEKHTQVRQLTEKKISSLSPPFQQQPGKV